MTKATRNGLTADDALRDRVAIVTGAGRGLGRGAAVGLARRGALVVAMARTRSELDRTAALAPEGRIVPMVVDLAVAEQVTEAYRQVVSRHGSVDVLINNAGMLPLEPFERTPPDLWNTVMQVNLTSAYQLAWLAYPDMIQRGTGVISNVSSGAGVRPFVLETAYCASKYALEGWTRSLAAEALSHGVTVTLTTPAGAPSKPTSMTETAFLELPATERARYADDLDVAEAFGWIAAARDPLLAGRRLDLHGLGALVREHGWALDRVQAVQRVTRDC